MSIATLKVHPIHDLQTVHIAWQHIVVFFTLHVNFDKPTQTSQAVQIKIGIGLFPSHRF